MTTARADIDSAVVTADELLTIPDEPDGTRYELVLGRLIPVSPASLRSNLISGRLMRWMGAHVEQNDLGEVSGSEGGFLLARNPDTVRAPDVWFLSKERIPAGGIPDGYWPGAPDLVVEVLSPSDRPGDTWRRVADYLGAGARLVCVLDPHTGAAVLFPPTGLPLILGSDDELDLGDVVPGFSLALHRLLAP